jgi:Kef-type K+ transport system membrane component KefB
MSSELVYVGLIFGLFIVPKLLQRFAIPSAITALLLGAGLSMGLGWFVHDGTVDVLATLGIVSLFLFAGLEVDFGDLRRDARVLVQHLVIRALMLGLFAFAAMHVLHLAWRPAALITLALLTPSTGFILDSLRTMKLNDEQKRWIKSKAIAGELLALGTLFVVLQSTSTQRMLLASGALIAIVAVLPVLFRVFAARIAPHAPRSEFTFLLMMALLCAYATKQLGVYYLVGAFVVGIAAQRFREELPALASEKMLDAVELFASFFIPFYFFRAGSHIDATAATLDSALIGGAFLLVAIPTRIGVGMLHRRIALGEPPREAARIQTALLPTLVFTLVLAEILRSRFAVPDAVFGGLVLYTLINTMLPGFVLRIPPPSYDQPHARELDAAHAERMQS